MVLRAMQVEDDQPWHKNLRPHNGSSCEFGRAKMTCVIVIPKLVHSRFVESPPVVLEPKGDQSEVATQLVQTAVRT